MRSAIWAFAILAGVLSTQATSLVQQYHQRLGGAVHELQRLARDFDADAARQNLTRQQALSVMHQSKEGLIRARAVTLDGYVGRLNRLTYQQVALADPSLFSVLTLVSDHDPELLKQTLHNFYWSLPGSAIISAFLVSMLIVIGFEGLFFLRWVLVRLVPAQG